MVNYESNDKFREEEEEEKPKRMKKIKEEEEYYETQRGMENNIHDEEKERRGRPRSVYDIIEVLSDELEIRRMEQTAIDLLQDFMNRIGKINATNLDGVLLHIKIIINILSKELEVLRLRQIRVR